VLVPIVAFALAAGPTNPTDVVKRGNDEVQKILKSEEGTVEKLATKADEFIDFVELAKRALGKEWTKLNKKQQDEFAATMKGLLRASYAQRAVQEGKGGGDLEYGAEKIEGNEASVVTNVLVKKDKVPVEYKLYRVDPKAPWRIYDVVTDQVSLVSTYNDQFRQLISKKGYDGLLSTLKKRRDELEADSKKPVGAAEPKTEGSPAPAKGGPTGGSTAAPKKSSADAQAAAAAIDHALVNGAPSPE